MVLCHADADAGAAGELDSFLRANCPSVALGESSVFLSSGEFWEAVERALSALPASWARWEWEPALVDLPKSLGTQLAFLEVRKCSLPAVLRRRNFFDGTAGRLPGFRQVKRWLLKQSTWQQEPEQEIPARVSGNAANSEVLQQLERELVDVPGEAHGIPTEIVLEFAHVCRDDFERVFWVECHRRSRAGVLGETGRLARLKLTGRVERNQAELREWCFARRCLFVFEELTAIDRPAMTLGGKASVIFTESTTGDVVGRRECPSLEQMTQVLKSKGCPEESEYLGKAQVRLREWSVKGDATALRQVNELGP